MVLIVAVTLLCLIVQGAFILFPLGLFLRFKHIDDDKGVTFIILGTVSWGMIILGILLVLPVFLASRNGD